MAIQFNLLPWREARRQKQAKIAKIILLAAVVVGLLLSAGFYAWETARLGDHDKALTLITEKNNSLRSKLQEKRKLDLIKVTLNNQIDAIESLQANRASVTHMVEELSLANTQELYLTTFSLTNGIVNIVGVAENDLQISNFMIALKKSPWYQEPRLISIVAQNSLGDEVKQFTITSNLLLPGTNKNKGQ